MRWTEQRMRAKEQIYVCALALFFLRREQSNEKDLQEKRENTHKNYCCPPLHRH